MNSTVLYLRMALRRKVSVLLVVVFAAAVTGFLLSYPRLIDRTNVQLEHAYDSISIRGEALHKDGHSTPTLSRSLFYSIVDSGYLAEYKAGANYNAVLPKFYELIGYCPGYAKNDPALAQALSDVFNQKKQTNSISRNDPLGTAKGITDLSVHASLYQVREDIQWLEGYDATCLTGAEAVALVPGSYGYALGDTFSMAFELPAGYTPLSLKVVGLVPLSSETVVFLPLKTLEQAYLAKEETIVFSLSFLQFTLVDSRDLQDFETFLKTLSLGKQLNIRLDDEIFHGTIDPIQSNLKMLQSLYPVFFAAVAAIGFVLCFLLVRRRKQEFAVMRLLGEKTWQITGKALLEQAMLCVIGIVLGAAVVLAGGFGQFSAVICIGVLLCYGIGSALAVMLMVRVNVMEILRDKE